MEKYMKRNVKRNNTPILILGILIVVLACLLGGMVWFWSTHFFVGGRPYPVDTAVLDLRDQQLTEAEYRQIQQQMPNCEIYWNVPFQNGAQSNLSASLTVKSLSDRDLEMLAYFPKLTQVDATGCRDYDKLRLLQERYPQVQLLYTVPIEGTEYPQNAKEVVCSGLTEEDIAMMALLPELQRVDASGCREYARLALLAQAMPDVAIAYQVELLGQTFTETDTSATFQGADVQQLKEQLAYASALESVHLVEPHLSEGSMGELLEAYPQITFTWEKTVLGKTFQSTDTEFDFSGMTLSTDMVESAMVYFPNAEKVILSDCGMDNETLAAFREKMRPDYKVVWTVYITRKPVRTDQEVIHSSALKVCFIDEQSQDLKYCEDAIVVDIGHSYVKNLEWVKGMPKLKYLILAHNWVRDISPLSTCKNLVYLELFWNKYVEDYTPLLECTTLEDLNISGTYADIEPIYQMTWLKNLWANQCGLTEAEQNTLRQRLPNTTISTIPYGDYTAGGWRQTQGYYDMRDIMGLPYNTW